MDKDIIISGGWRTGSTVVFNLVKELTGMLSMGVTWPNEDEKGILYKCHCYMGSKFIIHTKRNYEDTAKSMLRIGFSEPKTIASILQNYISDRANLGRLTVDYDSLINEPIATFGFIRGVLKPVCDIKEVDLDKFLIENQKKYINTLSDVCSETEYRPNHITDKDKVVHLSPRIKAFLRELR